MKRLAWERCERDNAANRVGREQEDTLTGAARALRAGWRYKPGPCGLWLFKWKLGHFFWGGGGFTQPGTPAILAFTRHGPRR